MFILSRCQLNFYKNDQKLFLPAQENPFWGRYFTANSSDYMKNTCRSTFSRHLDNPAANTNQTGIWEGKEQMHKCLCKMVCSRAAWKAALCSCPAWAGAPPQNTTFTAISYQWQVIPGIQEQWIASWPHTGSASWLSRGEKPSSVSLHHFSTRKLFESIPTCSSDTKLR